MTTRRTHSDATAVRRMHLVATIAGRAACAGMPHTVFFPTPPPGPGARTVDHYATARTVCARCPVRPECLELSDTDPHTWNDGMFGGLDPDQRRAHRRHQREETHRG